MIVVHSVTYSSRTRSICLDQIIQSSRAVLHFGYRLSIEVERLYILRARVQKPIQLEIYPLQLVSSEPLKSMNACHFHLRII
jgi:hypothetical protein